MGEIGLKKDNFEKLYQILKSPVCDFDCGELCSKNNNGVPVCCEVNVVVPILYKEEYDYLCSNSTLWKKFKPKSDDDHELLEDCGYDDIAAVCKGHKNCDRDYRSLVCRTFPFYPFIDEEGVFIGLTYNYDFEAKCIIVGNCDIVSKTYLRELIEAWNYIFSLDEEEFEGHYNISREIEVKRKKEKKVLHILNIEGVREL